MEMLSRSTRAIFIGLLVIAGAILSSCGGGGGGGGSNAALSGGGANSSGVVIGTSSAFTNLPGSTMGSTKSYSLFLMQGSFTTSTNFSSNLVDASSFASYSTPYTDSNSSYFYSNLISDGAGNLWAVQNGLPSPGYNSLYIVKFSGANANPASLVRTQVITLPSNMIVQSMAFDSVGNLWVAQISTANSGAAIVEYTAASSYVSTGVTYLYAASTFSTTNTSYCGGTSIAFEPGDNLVAYEAYQTAAGTGHCSGQFVRYLSTNPGSTSAVTPPDVSLTNFATDPTLQGDLILAGHDSAGNLWALERRQGCSNGTSLNCTLYAGSIRKLPSGWTAGSSFQTIVTLSSTLPIDNNTVAALDSNGNLWYGGATAQFSTCSATNSVATALYELPQGQSIEPSQFAYKSGSTGCTLFSGLAFTSR
jgi:hypothetical protein